MRLAFLGAAVGTALTIPGLSGAGVPRLEFDVRPAVAVVLEHAGGRDSLITIDARNRGDRSVRVEHVRATYFERDIVVGALDPASSIFTRADLLSDPRVEPGGHDLWAGLCLEPPTQACDRVRFQFDLVERRGVRKVRATQFLDLRLRALTTPPVLALPVQGIWRVTQGHTCETNHRRGRLGGEFAWDLVAIGESGRSGAPGFDESHRNDESATFGRNVTAPVAGTVVSVADGVDDNDGQREFPRRSLVDAARAPRWVFGNYLVLDAGGGTYVLLAHLRKNSVAVRPGDIVREGEVVGQAGNSGNTMLPHLHIQVMDAADPAEPTVSGVPALFRDYIEISSSGDRQERDAIVRRVTAGDPPEGSVVVPQGVGSRKP